MLPEYNTYYKRTACIKRDMIILSLKQTSFAVVLLLGMMFSLVVELPRTVSRRGLARPTLEARMNWIMHCPHTEGVRITNCLYSDLGIQFPIEGQSIGHTRCISQRSYFIAVFTAVTYGDIAVTDPSALAMYFRLELIDHFHETISLIAVTIYNPLTGNWSAFTGINQRAGLYKECVRLSRFRVV